MGDVMDPEESKEAFLASGSRLATILAAFHSGEADWEATKGALAQLVVAPDEHVIRSELLAAQRLGLISRQQTRDAAAELGLGSAEPVWENPSDLLCSGIPAFGYDGRGQSFLDRPRDGETKEEFTRRVMQALGLSADPSTTPQ